MTAMSSSSPTVSLVIPTRNRAVLLRETLNSVLTQTYPNWEAIVVNDASTDDTPVRVAELAESDSRIRLLHRQGKVAGAPVCRNQGTGAASGEFVLYLDDDDLLAPFCLEHRVALLTTEPKLDFVVFPGELFQEMPGDLNQMWGTFRDGDPLPDFLRWDIPWQTSGPLWRRTSLPRLGGWDESLASWQDFDFHVRALLGGFRYKAVNQRDYFIRRNTRSTDNISKTYKPAHLLSKARLYRNLTTRLRESGLVTTYSSQLAGAFFYIAREWIWHQKNRAEALRVWQLCASEKLISSVQFAEGAFFLGSCEGHRGLTGLGLRYLSRRWPEILNFQEINES